ncbi:MAG TPA: hypothetical protein VFW47_12405 [Phenylobacterium sp.]|nr:hypothetical protein [Phenylobacterium sp.]
MRALFLGTSVATVIGLSAGGAMKPVASDFQTGPRSLTPASVRRATSDWSEAVNWTKYGADLPDYVIGADWVTAEIPMIEMESEPVAEAAPPPPPPPPPEPPRQMIEDDRQAPALSYPSVGGDILAGMDSYAPPTPPRDPGPTSLDN